ncbi:LacI family DNA-binding transcriptional regulator [Plantibacter sp. Mn2098]|uniref:LacI family DNA-binding transcriptional regulator n=1 Tax=Plantibacter sp. Mn2098 TaxID=3395266 RepID=UPI003BC82CBB
MAAGSESTTGADAADAADASEASVPARLRLTETDLARHLGISRATVSRALYGSGRVSDATRERVIAAADELGFVPNMMASELAAGRSKLIGLLLRDSTNPVYGQLFDSLQTAAHARGMELVSVTATHDGDGRAQMSGLRRLLGMRVAGLIIATGDVPSEQLLPFSGDVPMIRAGRPEPHDTINAVSYDEELHGRMLADHLFLLGHRRIAVVTPSAEVSYPEWSRAVAMADRLASLGAVLSIVPAVAQTDGVEAALDEVVAGRVSAIMCPTDLRQLEVLRAAAARGIRVPEDVSVTGCDGLLHGSDLLGLTTVRLPVEALAVRTIERMAELLAAPAAGPAAGSVAGSVTGPAPIVSAAPIHDILPGTLIPGATTAPV